MLNTLSSVSVRESRIQYLCDPQWFRDTASRGPTTIVAPESQFRTRPTDHDNIGYPRMSASGESSTTMHRILHASGSHRIPPPNDPKPAGYEGRTKYGSNTLGIQDGDSRESSEGSANNMSEIQEHMGSLARALAGMAESQARIEEAQVRMERRYREKDTY
ncbi:putative potassium transporter 9 [Dorcoceras hygrometricum]|uniref:Putative potassium transporter 9 n=1 Tax=Dorcoceras hygrometricum TaxID=472368 RepID=A0A2Z7C2B8_9LAMI|nr:putative potassium transporter 9 [Dorcoceras hygrometricum]